MAGNQRAEFLQSLRDAFPRPIEERDEAHESHIALVVPAIGDVGTRAPGGNSQHANPAAGPQLIPLLECRFGCVVECTPIGRVRTDLEHL